MPREASGVVPDRRETAVAERALAWVLHALLATPDTSVLGGRWAFGEE